MSAACICCLKGSQRLLDLLQGLSDHADSLLPPSHAHWVANARNIYKYFLQEFRQPQGPIGTDSSAAAESADRLKMTDDAAAERAYAGYYV